MTLKDEPTLTEQVDTLLIANGYPAECVTWVCGEHRRHCVHLGIKHTQHECVWDVPNERFSDAQ